MRGYTIRILNQQEAPAGVFRLLGSSQELHQRRGLDFEEVRVRKDLLREPRKGPSEGDEEACGSPRWQQPTGPQGEKSSRLRSGAGAIRARKPRYDRYQELTTSIEEIFVNSQGEVDFRPPMPLKRKVLEKHKDKFSLFHNTAKHTTATCFDLKDEVEYLIRRGKLTGYHKDAN